MKIHWTTLILVCLMVPSLLAQDTDVQKLELPECEIFLFDLSESEGKIQLTNGRNVTKRDGYDNQPWFTPGSKSFLFSANGKPDRTDVFEYFIESGETKQVTDSADQEYSPQVSPDNQTLSFVTDGATANQSIWRQNRNGEGFQWLLKGMGEREPVGYYSWNHESGYILFWSRYGFSLRLTHESKQLSHYVTGNAVPSTPYVIPGTKCFSFVHRQGNSSVWIKELNPETLAIRPLTVVAGSGNNNYAWTPDGWILMCDGTQLKRWSESSEGWQVVDDLANHGMTSASRVAVSPDGKHLAVVGLPKE